EAGELDGAALAVAVAQGEDREGGLLPQHLLAELAGGLVVVHRPGAAHVAGHGAAVLGAVRAGVGGGGVELQGARRGQQRADRVQQGGLAGAGPAGEEVALGGDRQVVGAVEGPPVRDLDGDEPPLPGVGVVGVALLRLGGGVGLGHAGEIEGVGCGIHPCRVPSRRVVRGLRADCRARPVYAGRSQGAGVGRYRSRNAPTSRRRAGDIPVCSWFRQNVSERRSDDRASSDCSTPGEARSRYRSFGCWGTARPRACAYQWWRDEASERSVGERRLASRVRATSSGCSSSICSPTLRRWAWTVCRIFVRTSSPKRAASR